MSKVIKVKFIIVVVIMLGEMYCLIIHKSIVFSVGFRIFLSSLVILRKYKIFPELIDLKT